MPTDSHQELASRFAQVRAADLRRFPERAFLCRWAFNQEYHASRDVQDILAWVAHIEMQAPGFDHAAWSLPVGPAERHLIDVSAAFNDGVFARLFGPDARNIQHQRLDFYNMSDWVLQHAYPRPLPERLERVLDFGAGFGRQAALWLSLGSRNTYVALDAIESMYVAQTHYLGSAPFPLLEYLDAPGTFAIEDAGRPASFHVPGGRFDLLPTGFFDMVLCVQVLPEIHESVLFHSLSLFRRVLRDGGYLYVRDHGPAWMPGHQQLVPEILPRFGFVLEFCPRWRDTQDLHGLPQIWRKVESGTPGPRPLAHPSE